MVRKAKEGFIAAIFDGQLLQEKETNRELMRDQEINSELTSLSPEAGTFQHFY